MAYSASDYPQVKRASEAYDVAKAARLKAQRLFDETSTKSSKYAEIAAALAAAKRQEEAKFNSYKSTNDAAKADYERKSISVKATSDASSARVAINSLNEQLKKAEDSGQDLTTLKASKTAAEKKLADAVAAKKTATKKTSTIVEPAATKTTTDKAAADKVAADKAAADKLKTNKTKIKTTTPAAYTTKEAADLAATVGGTNYFGAKYGTPANETGTKTATGEQDINAIYALARSKYGNVDSIFLYDPELRQLLIDAVGDPTTAVGDMEPEEFARRLAASDWAVRNATTYARRDAERRQYTETLDKYNQQLALADTQLKKDEILSKIGQLETTSSYARGLASAKAYIESVASGLTGTLDPVRLDAFVKKMYDSANDKDPNIINRELSALISYKPGSQLGGAIGGDLVTLRATAKANGFDLDKTFGDQINGWLQRLAKGESVETFKNVIRSQAKLGLPDKVSNLLDQGLDLANIYEPYKRLMANVLELAPDSIDLNDATLRSAIGADKEMSLYDFQRTLRKDSRWQYTDNARADVSTSVLQVLRDFGFQG